MSIHQIQVSFDAVQDRLVLRVSTHNREEYLAWLTRRLVRQLWPHLTRILTEHLQGGAGSQPTPVQEQPKEPAQRFDQPYKADDLTHPLGINPLLVGEASFDTSEPGFCRLILREPKERSFHFSLDRNLMEAFCSMLRATVLSAAWDLGLDYVPSTPSATPQRPTGVLH